MLILISDQPSYRLGTLLSALIVVFCVIGLTMHRDFYAGKRRKDFFCFYTNLSNLLVLVYFGLIAPRLYARAGLRAFIPHVEFAVTMCIMLTGCVFHLMLFPAIRRRIAAMPHTREYCIVCVDNLIIHYIVPLLVLIYWLLCAPAKASLTFWDAFLWTAIPLIYAGAILLHARRGAIIEETGSPYPYPFFDISVLGPAKVLRLCAGMYGICAACSLAVLAAIRLLHT